MLDTIQLSYPTYFLLFCLLAGLIYAFSLYFKSRNWENNNPKLPWLLSILRFLSVAGLVYFLLSPFIKHLTETKQDPIIIFAQDASESIKLSSTPDDLLNFNNKLKSLSGSLSDNFTVYNYQFGDEVQSELADSFDVKVSNLSNVFIDLDNKFSDQNVGAIVLATDGIFNEGMNPLYVSTEIKAPIYTIAQGDTSIRRDVVVKNILHNRIAYLGDKFQMQVDIQAENAVGQNTKLKLYKIINDKRVLLDSRNIKINSNSFFQTENFEIEAKDVGNIPLYVSLDAISDEVSTINNNRKSYIEILDARQKILVMANAPHPDIAALKQIIESNKNYEVDLVYPDKAPSQYNNTDLVILHNLPSADHPLTSILSAIQKSNTPQLFLVGNQTELSLFNKAQDAVTINGGKGNMNNVQAILNSNFQGFTIDDRIKKQVPIFNPLLSPFGEYTLGNKTEVLFKQKIGTVDTDYPLIVFGETKGTKTSVITAEGIWKWKLFEHLKYKTKDVNEQLFNKIIQYSSFKKDKRRFRSFVSQNIFAEKDDILFDAQLYNKNYELINEPEVFLEIRDKEGNKYEQVFSRTGNYYSINAGTLTEGNYNYIASCNYEGKSYEDKGKFSVQSIEKEQYDLTARHDLLFSLSKKYDGKLFYPSELDMLKDSLTANKSIKPVLYSQTTTEPLLNLKWLLGILLLFLILEWFIRRFYGSY